MLDSRERMKRSGAYVLVLGILTLVLGVTVGVLGIVNGGLLLGAARDLQ